MTNLEKALCHTPNSCLLDHLPLFSTLFLIPFVISVTKVCSYCCFVCAVCLCLFVCLPAVVNKRQGVWHTGSCSVCLLKQKKAALFFPLCLSFPIPIKLFSKGCVFVANCILLQIFIFSLYNQQMKRACFFCDICSCVGGTASFRSHSSFIVSLKPLYYYIPYYNYKMHVYTIMCASFPVDVGLGGVTLMLNVISTVYWSLQKSL